MNNRHKRIIDQIAEYEMGLSKKLSIRARIERTIIKHPYSLGILLGTISIIISYGIFVLVTLYILSE